MNLCIFTFLIFLATFGYADETFVSLKKNKVNVRYGPSFESDVKYVYKKINLPLKQIDKKENFRRIIDFKHNSGWIHISQLKKSTSVILTKKQVIFSKPTKFSKPIAVVEKGKLFLIKNCKNKWCKIKENNLSGWILFDNYWGKLPN